ncbi:MAG: class I SAM-dependent methyltransferase [Aureliella sp.]
MKRIEVQEIDCPLCSSREYRRVCQIVDSTYGVEGSYQVVRCKSCAHLYLNPRPADSSLLDCYPTDYAPHTGEEAVGQTDTSEISSDDVEPCSNTQADQAASSSAVRRVLRAIPGLRKLLFWLGQENATYLPDAPQPGRSRLLEVGCAHGGFLEQAQASGWVVDGVEPSELAATAARSKGFDVHCGFLADADIQASSRDVVAMWMVLEHVPNPVELVDEVHRILRPGGIFTFSVPNASTWERWVFGRHWLGYDAPRHLQVFSVRRLRRLLVDQGFGEIRVIHQANTRYWWGSVAAWGKERFQSHKWPDRWMHYFTAEPPAWWSVALLLPGKLIEVARCSGRITVIATKT